MLNFFRHGFPRSRQRSLVTKALPAVAAPPTPLVATDPLGVDDPVALREYLVEAGHALGIFSDVRSNRRADGHFELVVNASGRWTNIVDVGYGVHSVLPLLISMFTESAGTVFLLQQPESQLHPSAQATLAQRMAESNHRFVIENAQRSLHRPVPYLRDAGAIEAG